MEEAFVQNFQTGWDVTSESGKDLKKFRFFKCFILQGKLLQYW
jgi:hypothetical protein